MTMDTLGEQREVISADTGSCCSRSTQRCEIPTKIRLSDFSLASQIFALTIRVASHAHHWGKARPALTIRYTFTSESMFALVFSFSFAPTALSSCFMAGKAVNLK